MQPDRSAIPTAINRAMLSDRPLVMAASAMAAITGRA
jgi:hypothetical protein